MTLRRTVQILGYLGLVPFIITLGFEFNQQTIFGISASRIFLVYSGVILTFVAGAVWGKITKPTSSNLSEFSSNTDSEDSVLSSGTAVLILFAVLTNVLALLAWIVILASDDYDFFAIFLLMIGFVVVLWIEMELKIRHANDYQNKYFSMRWKLTVVVSLSHIIMLFLIR